MLNAVFRSTNIINDRREQSKIPKDLLCCTLMGILKDVSCNFTYYFFVQSSSLLLFLHIECETEKTSNYTRESEFKRNLKRKIALFETEIHWP